MLTEGDRDILREQEADARPTKPETYRAGRADHPSTDDEYYESENDALEVAQAATKYNDTVCAVWRQYDEDTYDTLYLVYQGDIFRPV